MYFDVILLSVLLGCLGSYIVNDVEHGFESSFCQVCDDSLNVAIVDLSVKYFTGVAGILFDYQSYSKKIAVFRSIDLIGDFPVKSTDLVPFFGLKEAWYVERQLFLYIVICRCRYLFVSSISNAVLNFSLILLITFFLIFIWPLYVAGAESWRYFWTTQAVKPVHIEILFLLIAFSTVCLGIS